MNSEQLNRWLTLFANIGVLIGIILLLIELNQTQEIARAEIRNEIYQGLTNSLSLVSRDEAELLARANAGEALSPADIILLSRRSESIHRYWENANYQYEIGLYDETEYSAHRFTIRNAILELFHGALIPHFRSNRVGYSESYRMMVDEYVTPDVCETL